MTVDLDHLRGWIGRREEAVDVVAAGPLQGLSATLDRDDAEPRPGDAVPPGGHWLYFLPRTRASELAADGHAERGGFLPPVPLPRRMWAGGRLEFLKPLRVGDRIRRISEVSDVTAKEGRSGPLVFVRVRHEISGPDGPALIEDHDIVYRGEENTAARPRPAPGEAVWRRTIRPDPVMLFRYSALIFNAHRIHYDHRYVTDVEGYPGLVVHGPLIATLVLDLCRRERPQATVRVFDYRALGPLFDDAAFTVAGQPGPDGASARVWAEDAEGALAMTATAAFAR